MPRRRSLETLERVLEAARAVFAEHGLDGARIAEVARRAGVAHGTVYGYAAGKEALFELAMRGRPLPPLASLPWPAPDASGLTRAALARSEAIHALPELDLTLERSDVGDPRAEVGALLAAHHGRVRAARHELAALERSAAGWPAVARGLERHRRDLAERTTRYLESRIALGWLARPPDTGIAARAVLDAVARCARREQHDPDPRFVAEPVARDTVVTILVRGLLAPEGAGPAAEPAHSVH